MPDDNARNPVAEYVEALKGSDRVSGHLVHHREEASAEPEYAEPRRPWPKAVADVLALQSIEKLYSHQALAADLIRSGQDVVVATPTASGKSLIYNLPLIESFLRDPDTRGLYLFPLKALAQDQLKNFTALTAHWPKEARPSAAIYDGDTTPWFRKKIRNQPPNVVMTNPEMLHLSFLPFHDKWATFLASLSFIVVDEAHTYRGVLGSHMAQIFRRLNRICAHYGVRPTFIFCSATLGNPRELAFKLTGREVKEVTQSGAPRGKRHFLFLNPEQALTAEDGKAGGTGARVALTLLRAALPRELRTIVYTQSRKMTELISLWASERAKGYQNKISAYRAGFLPEERRDIEQRLASGDLLGVISTSALELGIDIGHLDLCVLVGYPGTIMATLQRGGRVGRALRESAVALVAGEDALDQYFMRHPQDFFERPPECAVLNPDNPVILARHLECAAAEMSLKPDAQDNDWLGNGEPARVMKELEQQGTLLRAKDGFEVFAGRKRPHRDVSLRGSGATYQILSMDSETSVGEIEEARAFKETHTGAVYLHRGDTYVVEELDIGTRTVKVRRAKVDYYTRVRGNKITEILELKHSAQAWGTQVSLGRLKVTETITGYEKRRIRGGTLMGITPLDLPAMSFETEGIWFEIPLEAQRAVEADFLHFMGGIHAMEHAMIGILPLLVMTDRNDLGGISTPMHAQVGAPAVFVYDGAPGGVGLSTMAFAKAEELLERTLAVVKDCDCEYGCPSCVHSPKCGSGNRPIDKDACLRLLELLKTERYAISSTEDLQNVLQSTKNLKQQGTTGVPERIPSSENLHFGVLDVETRRSAQEVGGWHKADKMGVSVAVLYDSQADEYLSFQQDELGNMFERLREFDLVVGFNILRFDYTVLSPFAPYSLAELPTLDMLKKVHERLNYRLSLDRLAQETLGAEKSADGLQALEWFKQGKMEEIAEYCRRDVELTRDLYLHGRDKGYLLFRNKAGKVVRLPVDW